ncbi:LLM class flavin-dependent oxidoreductase [Rummeliibacillus pycnus]|uniref:LLM class flavin-dependent oxidoreductase n=1 Tax=Rummeliibacillus pycnus TaxID=101070 RepID=UPI000C99C267|nr:LLM class flavin-dependent oxidoreductase [Rummeliibacillus pycnus]
MGNGKKVKDIELSVLDLVAVLKGHDAAYSFQNSLKLAQKVETFGYKRYWFAEHHNSPSIASSATSLLISHIAQGTEKIRVGSGGIMLPNHVPLVIAEQFGTLDALYPGRIDLGLGRAPGTDPITAQALRRNLQGSGEDFPQNVLELQQYLSDNPNGHVHAYPGEGSNIPIYLLGSSLFSARLAGMLGLPYAFASHFAPTYLRDALRMYRDSFQPSEQLKEPYTIACVNVIAADSNEEAKKIASSLYLYFLNVVRGTKNQLNPPVDSLDGYWSDAEKSAVMQSLYYTFIGDEDRIAQDLGTFVADTDVDEIMACSHIYDPAARIRSYEILANAIRR